MQLDFLKPTDVIGMAVCNQEVVDLFDTHTQAIEGLATFGTTVNQQMLVSFDDKHIGLIQRLSESGAGTNKKERWRFIVGQLHAILRCR